MSWNFNTGSNNNNNNNNNNTLSWNNNNNNNNTNNQNSWNIGNNNNNNTNQSQFVTYHSRFESLPNDKKTLFATFETQVIKATEKKQNEVSETLKKVETLRDISRSLSSFKDESNLLTEKIRNYEHELEPFHQKLRRENLHATRLSDEIERSNSIQVRTTLPPAFYWDKISEFQQQLTDLRSTLENLQQHLNDTANQQTQIINTKSITSALNATHRSTINIASRVVANHNQVQKLKHNYKQFRLQNFGDSHDPFVVRSQKQTNNVTYDKFSSFQHGLESKGLHHINPSIMITNTNANANTNNNTINNGNNNNNNNNNKSGSNFTFGNNNNNINNNNTQNNNNSTYNWGATPQPSILRSNSFGI